MATIKYKGFSILAWPYQLRDSKRWAADLEIRGRGRRQPVGLDERFASEQEAEARCSRVGRQLIDNGISGWPADAGSPRRWAFIPLRKEMVMRASLIAGIVILCLGVVVLVRGGTFTTERDVLRVGDAIRITADERQTIPPWVGGGAMLMGAVLIMTSLRKRA